MKNLSRYLIFILSTFFIGNICLIFSYILIYLVTGQSVYANEIMNLSNIHVLLFQIIGSGLISVITNSIFICLIYSMQKTTINLN